MGVDGVAVAILGTLVAAIPLGLTLWALVDAARRPAWAWALADRRQAAWIGGIVFSAFTVIGGIAVSCWYLLRIRPQIDAAEQGRF